MAQILVPTSDIAPGTWTTTPLWSKVDDDSVANPTGDGVEITSADNTAPDIADFAISAGTDPLVTTGHILRARWRKHASGGHVITARLRLYQGDPTLGGTLVATLVESAIGDVEVESTAVLNTAAVNAITDYTDLYLRLERDGDTGGNPATRRSLVADLIEFEIPNAPATISVGGTITPAGAYSDTGAIPPSYVRYYPDSDDSVGAWTVTPLWSKINDDPTNSAADSDSITTPDSDSGGGSPFVCGIETIPSVDTYVGWRIRIRCRVDSGDRALRVMLRRQSDQTNLTATSEEITITNTSFDWVEFPVVWSQTAIPDLIAANILNDLSVWVDPQGTTFFADLFVSAVELLVPDLSGQPFGTPSWSDVEISPNGRSGPYRIGTDYYALGYDPAEKVAWLFKATGPTDGHNPGEWSRFAPVAEAAKSPRFNGMTPADKGALVGMDMIHNATGELALLATGDNAQPLASTTPLSTMLVIDPTTGPFGTTRHLGLRNGLTSNQDANNDVSRWEEQTDTVDDMRAVFDTSTQSMALRWTLISGSDVVIAFDPHQLFDLIAADGRMHVFFGVTEDAQEDGIRQRTVRADDTAEAAPGSDITSEDHLRSGIGAAYSNGTVWRVVSAYPQADGGGITAIVFDSADTPTPGTEIVTTRDAYDAAYEVSVVAIPVGSGTSTRMIVVWIDDAADAIYAAHRLDGETTWTAAGEQVAGSAGRTRLSGGPVDTDTITILVDDGTGPEFYTLNFSFGTVETVNVAGTVTPAAAHTTTARKPFTAGILNQGNEGLLTKTTRTTLAGTTTPAAELVRRARKLLDAAITSVGAVAVGLFRTITLTGTATPEATVSRETRQARTATITPTGETTRSITQALAGSLAPAAAHLGRTLLDLAGTITPAGTSDHQIQTGQFFRTFSGALATSGALLLRTAHRLEGTATPTGATADKTTKTFSGDVTPTGTRAARAGKALTATITPTATIARAIQHILAGSIAATGARTARTLHSLASSITAAGDLSNVVNPGGFDIALAGTLTATGDLIHRVANRLEGSTTPTSATTRSTRKTRAGTATPTGATTKTPQKAHSGLITPTGALGLVEAIRIAVSGALGTAGALQRRTATALSGQLNAASLLTRSTARRLAGTLAPSGTTAKTTRLALQAAIALAGDTATQIFNVLAGPITRLIRDQGRSRAVHHQGETR